MLLLFLYTRDNLLFYLFLGAIVLFLSGLLDLDKAFLVGSIVHKKNLLFLKMFNS